MCISCVPNYSLCNTLCYPTNQIVQNMYGCFAYQQCTNACLDCLPGFYMIYSFDVLNNICIPISCGLPNCQFCFRSTFCIVCQLNYALNSVTNVCQPMAQNCTQLTQILNCIQCNNTVCLQCAVGYLLMNNECVCNITGCEYCMGAAYCMSCIFPFVNNYMSGQGNCVPIPFSYMQCNVAHCQQCYTIT